MLRAPPPAWAAGPEPAAPALPGPTAIPMVPSYPEQLHDEDEGLWRPLQLVQVVVARAVVVEHVAHAAAMLLAFQGVPALRDSPHALGHQGVHAGVLQGESPA